MNTGLRVVASIRSARTAQIGLIGELCFDTVGPARHRLLAAVDAGCHRLVVDATELRYCDTSGLGLLLSLRARLLDEGGTLELRHARGQVRSLLERTCTDELLCTRGLDGAVAQEGVRQEGVRQEGVFVQEAAAP